MGCYIEAGLNQQRRAEFATTYGDRTVGCYICAPPDDLAFCVHFTADTSLGPGLAIFVFIDGQYQANRNVTGLGNTATAAPSSKMDLRIRQKEETASNGSFMTGREWRFSTLPTGGCQCLPQNHPIN